MRKDKLDFFVDYISGSRYAPTWEARVTLTVRIRDVDVGVLKSETRTFMILCTRHDQ